MQIGGASSSFSPAASALPSRPFSPANAPDPHNQRDGQQSARADSRSAIQEQQLIAELVSRDREVRAHEQAHAAAGGPYAGAPSYSYARGPDGRRYAVAGEVAIDLGPVPNDPQATLHKMEVVLGAALAPAEPSAQDRRVAAEAQAQMVQARVELAELQRDERTSQPQEGASQAQRDSSPEPTLPGAQSSANLHFYHPQEQPPLPGRLVDFRV
ncbi:putative metalloprotease CJM1_0395 family protein [Pseudomonas benzenivorans]|uniref:SprA-related family protein n=1 Tax=Pseudomonas benzenivorans TaxID=556533 RepID=A0ABY5H2S6_9PSED|nr:putative metalloprotease CJM1_0395 family protein [Pseudomonas benzenivorans]UTW06354.1 hypothetical protein KDW96_14300 [Pseudomonas benzenivorans]